ncbi:efflux RND transporter permease subunit [Parahaliea maris]|uniref:Efflux RND transporter permease subunit n=1 Tax=Parahaliea maris TaxID=2716870 RepID=A0A5C8ZSE9_9GAMM|nr:efflux RND transporter permease subunit [Parahaliea maris]TXS90291.1 efflux RND transporter permease subunit [Parahaliea maris]
MSAIRSQDPRPVEIYRRAGIIAWFASNPIAANLLMLTAIIAGLLSLGVIRKEAFPSAPADRITVSVNFDTGSTPEIAEEGIALKVEEALEEVPGIKSITSQSSSRGSTVTIEKLSDYDLDQLLQDVKSQVDAINTFPTSANKPVVAKQRRQQHVLWVQVFGDSDRETLQTLAERIKSDLLEMPDVSNITFTGKAEPMMQIEIDRGRLQSYGLTIDDISRAINAESSASPSTSLRNAQGVVRLTTTELASTISEFSHIPLITNAKGTVITLGDIAELKDGFNDEALVLARYNGENSIGIELLIGEDGDIIRIADQGMAIVEKWQTSGLVPEGVKIVAWYDRSQFIIERLTLLTKNGLGGIALVFIILALFLNIRVAFWVAAGLPFIFLGTLFFMTDSFVGITINEMSTFGFIMALGIVVDDAVVVGESVYTTRRIEGDSLQSTIQGVHRVAVPTLIGVMTTVAAFVCLSQVEGILGRIYSQFGIVVAICLMLSVVESKLILPAHLAHLDTHRKEHEGKTGFLARLQNAADRGLTWFNHNIYRVIIKKSVQHRYMVIGAFLSVLIAVLSMPFTGAVRIGFFPAIQDDVIRANLAMQNDVSFGQTRKNLLRLEAAARLADKELRGNTDQSAISSMQVAATSDQAGSIEVELQKGGPYQSNEFADRWRQLSGFPEGTRQLRIMAIRMPVENLRIELKSWSVDSATAAGMDLKGYLEQRQGVSGIDDNLSGGEARMRFKLTELGRAMGLDMSDLSSQLLQSFGGGVTQKFQRGKDEVRVRVSFPDNQRQTLDDVLKAQISTPDGRTIPINSVVSVLPEIAPQDITRIDGLRSVYISGVVDKELVTPDELVSELKSTIIPDLRRRYPDLIVRFSGEAEQQRETTDSMERVFAITMLIIYALLAVPLRSYIQPLLIMTAIPFGLVGAVLGHWFHGLTLSVLSLNGVLALSGVVVNDSLLLVSRFNQLIEEGLAVKDAIVEACTNRLRAVLLTSVTTFAGLAPLLSETTLSAQFLIPAAAALAYGILFATGITLVLVPCLLQIQEDAKSYLVKRPKSGVDNPAVQNARAAKTGLI